MGIVHDLADTREEMMDKAFAWIEAHPKAMQAWDEVNKKTGKIQAKEHFKTPGGNALSPKGAQLFLGGTAMTLTKTYTNYPAPTEIMTAVYEGLLVNFDKSLSIEARHFAKLVQSSVAKNLIRTMFFGLNEINKGANRPKNEPPTDVKKLGVLGAGMMGAGIAYVSAMAGIQVILKDVSIEQAEKGKDYTRHLLKKAIERGKMNEAKAQEIANLIVPTVSANDLVGCDLLIEAVFENRELKAQVTQEAEGFLTDAGVLGSNTSTLPITSLAKATKRPSHFIGIHFFSPVDKMQLVEIIMGKDTSDYALAVAIDYVRKIRKTPIVVNDLRGFYTSRVFGTYSAEGMELLKDGTDPQLIENVAKYMGMPVGPLAVTDEVALDLVYKVASAAIHDGALDTSDISYQMSKQMMDLGRLGKKVKAGFYDYPENGKKHLWKGLQELFPTKIDSISADDVKKRLLYRQALETVKCWEEGVIRSKTDADIGSIFAWGFPPYLGGTLSFVDTIGIQNFVKECDNLANQYGERFRPTAKLREMAASNQGFYQ
jgi:3-hydroxyacyl-CoA dehydrogenase/enoyl-CoA hydratase/3-hydroxybutyryl-CoA epimerase